MPWWRLVVGRQQEGIQAKENTLFYHSSVVEHAADARLRKDDAASQCKVKTKQHLVLFFGLVFAFQLGRRDFFFPTWSKRQ